MTTAVAVVLMSKAEARGALDLTLCLDLIRDEQDWGA